MSTSVVLTTDIKHRIRITNSTMDGVNIGNELKNPDSKFYMCLGAEGQIRIIGEREYKSYFEPPHCELNLQRQEAIVKELEVCREPSRITITVPRIMRILTKSMETSQEVILLLMDNSVEIWTPEKYAEFLMNLAQQSEKAPAPRKETSFSNGVISSRTAFKSADLMGRI